MKKRKILLWTTFGISAALVIADFILTLGIIDNSVLIAVGELGFFGVLAEIPSYLESKKDISITKGNATITIADINNDNNE